MLRLLREWRDRSRVLRDERKGRRDVGRRARLLVENSMQASKRALESGDRATALRVWQEARVLYPDLVMESRAALNLLIGLQRFDEAAALMQEGCRRDPRNPSFLEGAAFVATSRYDNEESARLYAILRKKFPRVAKGYTDATVPLIRLGRLDEAERVLSHVAAGTPPIRFLQSNMRNLP